MSDQDPDSLRLDQFLKLKGIAETGGQSKVMIQAGEVKLNGTVETRRRKKLSPGDVVSVGEEQWIVSVEPNE